jgi:dipeptidyl-peptidase-4
VTEYATDREVRRAVFAMSGRLFLADIAEAITRELSVPGPVDDPRLDPTGERIAYAIDGALHVREIEGGDRVLASDDEPDVRWGLAEFAAAEEMNRRRGHWWSPDGAILAAARVDERLVRTWYIADQTDPAAPPRAVRYPQAGTEDAVVTLHLFDVETGGRTDVVWDAAAFPYLGRFHWSEGGGPLLVVVSRDQPGQLLEVDRDRRNRLRGGRSTRSGWTGVRDPLRPVRRPCIVTVVADRETDTNRPSSTGAVRHPGPGRSAVPHVGDESVPPRTSRPRSTCGAWSRAEIRSA